jgi:hypothetical protein
MASNLALETQHAHVRQQAARTAPSCCSERAPCGRHRSPASRTVPAAEPPVFRRSLVRRSTRADAAGALGGLARLRAGSCYAHARAPHEQQASVQQLGGRAGSIMHRLAPRLAPPVPACSYASLLSAPQDCPASSRAVPCRPRQPGGWAARPAGAGQRTAAPTSARCSRHSGQPGGAAPPGLESGDSPSQPPDRLTPLEPPARLAKTRFWSGAEHGRARPKRGARARPRPCQGDRPHAPRSIPPPGGRRPRCASEGAPSAGGHGAGLCAAAQGHAHGGRRG